MKRKQKNILIGIVFGIFLGMKITSAIRDPGSMYLLDWLLIAFGIAVAILHFSPDKVW